MRKNNQKKNSPKETPSERSLSIKIQNLTLENEQYSSEYRKLKKQYLKLCHANSDTLRELEKERSERKNWELRTYSIQKEQSNVQFKLSNLSGRLKEMVSENKRSMTAQHSQIRQKIMEHLSSPIKGLPRKSKYRRVINIKRKTKKEIGQQENMNLDSEIKLGEMKRKKKKKKKPKKKAILSRNTRVPFTRKNRSPLTDRENRMMKDVDSIITSFHALKEILKKQKSFLTNAVSSQVVRAGQNYQASLVKVDSLRNKLLVLKAAQLELEKNMSVYRTSFEVENHHKKDYQHRILPLYETTLRKLRDEKRCWDDKFEDMEETILKQQIHIFVSNCLFNVTKEYEKRNFSHYQNTTNLQAYIHHFERVEEQHRQLTYLHAEEKRMREGRVTHLNNENRLLKLELRKNRTLVKKFQEEVKYLSLRLSEEKSKVSDLVKGSPPRGRAKSGHPRYISSLGVGRAGKGGVKRDSNMRKSSIRGVKREIFKRKLSRGSFPSKYTKGTRKDRNL